ncbi:hypothetical protein EVG20_g10160 [Dentipellis fragilis]|uniref:Uncharacterized protein n=1 Tax=Dentipellis fragilis TaxID=205917 RepID=A0A4Y9XXM2_9AGAM|nr:hypothetical protein EVG20_g10160 [Dentipellis fragilis]
MSFRFLFSQRESKSQRQASAYHPSENKPKPGSRYRRVRDEFDTKGPTHSSSYQRGRAPTRGLLSLAYDSQETIKAPSAPLQHCLELLYDYYGRMRAFSRFHKPSFVVIEPEDGDVDMPSREYVDTPEQVIRPLPEPARLAPPATAWDGTVLDEDEYIAVLEVSDDLLPSAESSFILVEDSSEEETPRVSDSAVFVYPLSWTGYDSDTEDQDDDDADDRGSSAGSSYVAVSNNEPTVEEIQKCMDEVIAEQGGCGGDVPRICSCLSRSRSALVSSLALCFSGSHFLSLHFTSSTLFHHSQNRTKPLKKLEKYRIPFYKKFKTINLKNIPLSFCLRRAHHFLASLLSSLRLHPPFQLTQTPSVISVSFIFRLLLFFVSSSSFWQRFTLAFFLSSLGFLAIIRFIDASSSTFSADKTWLSLVQTLHVDVFGFSLRHVLRFFLCSITRHIQLQYRIFALSSTNFSYSLVPRSIFSHLPFFSAFHTNILLIKYSRLDSALDFGLFLPRVLVSTIHSHTLASTSTLDLNIDLGFGLGLGLGLGTLDSRILGPLGTRNLALGLGLGPGLGSLGFFHRWGALPPGAVRRGSSFFTGRTRRSLARTFARSPSHAAARIARPGDKKETSTKGPCWCFLFSVSSFFSFLHIFSIPQDLFGERVGRDIWFGQSSTR